MTTVEHPPEEDGHREVDQVHEGVQGQQALNQDLLLHLGGGGAC